MSICAGHAFEDDLRPHDARLHAFAHERDLLIHRDRKSAEPRDPVFVILHVFKPEPLAHFIRGLDAAALVDREQVAAKPEAGDVLFEILLEEIVVQLIRDREIGALDFAQPLERILRVLLAFADRFQAVVVPAIVPTPVAHRRSAGRVLLHLVFPFRVEEAVQGFRGIAAAALAADQAAVDRESDATGVERLMD